MRVLAIAVMTASLSGCAAMASMDPQTAHQMGQIAGCALGGGCSSPTHYPAPTYAPPVMPAPYNPNAYDRQAAINAPVFRIQPQPASPAPRYTAPRATEAQIAAAPNCTLDIHCGVGQVCVPTTYGKGYCARAVNRYGVPVHTAKPGITSCRWNTDCGPGFTCEKQPAQLDGYCVR
jgi:hypothetical protein